MQRWEYKVVAANLSSEDINELGNNGWEMCGVCKPSPTFITEFYFKRPRQYEKRTTILNTTVLNESSYVDLVTDGKREKEIEEEMKTGLTKKLD